MLTFKKLRTLQLWERGLMYRTLTILTDFIARTNLHVDREDHRYEICGKRIPSSSAYDSEEHGGHERAEYDGSHGYKSPTPR